MILRKVRKVVQYRFSVKTEGRYVFTLECGHITSAKVSQGMHKKKRCRECEIQNGTGGR